MVEPVLVLNANFEPIHVCGMKRALGLLGTGKASMILDGRGVVKTVSRTFPRPSIIRLERMVIRPRTRVKFSRREIFRRDNHRCQYCGKHSPNLTIDHVVPRRNGGRHTWDNVVTACIQCNHRKGGRTPEEASMKLLMTPDLPPSSAVYYFASHLNDNQDWVPFITGW